MRTIQSVIDRLPQGQCRKLLPRPQYSPIAKDIKLGEPNLNHWMLAVESMKYHMTNEGYEIALALEHSGYNLCGKGFDFDYTDVAAFLSYFDPEVVVLQDKREWDPSQKDFRDPEAAFHNVQSLNRKDLFNLTILKDSHQRGRYHRESAEEIGCNGWIIYYHPRIVKHLAPYVREEDCIRTYHSVNRDHIPDLRDPDILIGRMNRALVSGALSGVYPFRRRIMDNLYDLRGNTDYLKHPGYHRNGTHTDEFLQLITGYKVSICTTSVFGYSLRKIIESVACGCKVITDLPVDDVLPEIDPYLFRVTSETPINVLSSIIDFCIKEYNVDEALEAADKAQQYYDYRASGVRLANDIEDLRRKQHDDQTRLQEQSKPV